MNPGRGCRTGDESRSRWLQEVTGVLVGSNRSPGMEGWKFWWGVAAFFLGSLSTQLNGWPTWPAFLADLPDQA